MKQVYKKKPEYLDVIEVQDDTQSIKEVFELAGVPSAGISFDEKGNRFITLEDGTRIGVGYIVFKEKKSGKLVATPKEKILQFYEPYEEDVTPEVKKPGGLVVSDGRGIGGEVDE